MQMTRERFPDAVVATLRDAKILGIRAGEGPHRVIGIWVVVVDRRVFVRSWTLAPEGWYRILLDDPRGLIEVKGRRLRVRARRVRSEAIKKAVDRAYAEKYDTPSSLEYVVGFRRSKKRRDSTLELIPR